MKTKNVFYLYILMFLFFLLYFFSNISFAGDPKLINTLNGAFEKIENYILIRGSLFSYGFILCIDLILSLIKTLLT